MADNQTKQQTATVVYNAPRTDANSISKYEGELYATRADADATVESVKTVTTIDENGRQIK